MSGSFSFPHRPICNTRQISECSEDWVIILPMQTLIIGDIHGCFVEMQELLAAAGLSDGDTILATGDIVDRGPETPEVLQFFATQPNTRSVAGNHERKHIRSFAHEISPALSQVIAKEQIGDSYPNWVAFMASFPVYIDLLEALLVHAYFEPAIEPENQQIPVLCGHMAGELYLKKKYERPWYELYDRDKPVIVGHHDILRNGQIFVYQDRVFGLDTSCVHGKRLSGLLLPSFRVISVPSRGDHWRQISQKYRRKTAASKPSPPPRERPALEEPFRLALQAIVETAQLQNARLLAQLCQDPEYESLSPRQQAKRYAALLGDSPILALMHLARKGQLDTERAREVLQSPAQIGVAAQQLGLPSPDA